MTSPSAFFSDTASMLAATFSVAGDSAVNMGPLSPASTVPTSFVPEDEETAERTRRASMSSLPRDARNQAMIPYASRRSSFATNGTSSVTCTAISPSSSSRSLFPDLAMIAPIAPPSPVHSFHSPSYIEFSSRPNRRALVDHFCNVLSHLIVFREESGNPFQQLVLPLTARSGAVMDAMYALASAHLEYRGVQNAERSDFFHNRAIQGLARLIEREKRKGGEGTDRNELLGAIMLLVYYEVLVQNGRSNIVHGHLKGALAIMCSNPEPSDPTGIFLERAFRFYDVIAALSNGTAPVSAAPAAGCLVPFSPLGAPATSPLSSVDSLLGMATTLWPIIHRLSNLPALKTELEQAEQTQSSTIKIAVLKTEFETTAQAIETALTTWTPHLPADYLENCNLDHEQAMAVVGEVEDIVQHGIEVVVEDINPDPDCTKGTCTTRNRLHSILHNALAYRHSALVYLYRTIHELERSHSAVQKHSRAALRHCAATVSAGGPMSALLWPLFVAACEAMEFEDRELARKTFLGVEKRQGMMNIERARSIVEEVWRRADGEEGGTDGGFPSPLDGMFGGFGQVDSMREWKGQSCAGAHAKGRRADLWRRVSEDMGVNIVFG
ncbi:hypothetical protein DL546_001642 [Coniochaeta pulveracea]|uniref:Fungal Zn binuclear cluster domain containing protein n=1 Tax=Coniochaeta pulveracea TaxID=177199 RepID=A0A420Y0P8_9PEZI|nr:hypothetical protein DL546_001642 [Coniochaeta pulveracea]